MGRFLKCRAQLSPVCEHGDDEHEENEMAEDGTFDGETVICTSCYVFLMPHTPSGRGLNHELDVAVRKLKGLAIPNTFETQ